MFGRGGLPYIRICIIALTLATQTVVGDLFSSIHDMEALAHQENQFIHTLNLYIKTQQSRLDLLYRRLEQLMKARPPWLKPQELIGDPINAFALVRRLTREWPITLNLMASNADIERDLAQLPGEKDLASAVRVIARMQEVYNLETTEFTQERNLTSWGYVDFTARDCFEIGKHFSNKHKYDLAISWFKEALNKIITRNDSSIQQDQVLTHLFPATFYSDCKNGVISGNASNVLQYLMSQYPNYTLEGETSKIFKEAVYSNSKCDRSFDPQDAVEMISRAFSEPCQGIHTHFSSELRCFYIHYNNPRLLIAPFKMEELYLNPPILMFHDVVSDQEIEEMKTAFKKFRTKCKTVRVVNDTTYGNYHRQCDVGWVKDTYINASARLTRRAGDMTNLAVKTSEPNQVASYGLGGQFLPHYDFTQHSFPHASFGYRLATLMFYLSDVESGGFTVFVTLNVAVVPKKGSAIFWFNINHRGEELHSMLHGGCPVLRGSKWVLNKWIHGGEQNSDFVCPTDEIFPKQQYYLARDQRLE